MTNFLEINLHALRACTGQDPVLGPVGQSPRVEHVEDVESAGRRLSAALGTARPHTIFLVGCGRGAMLDAIDRLHPSARTIVLEPDPAALSRFLERRDWSAWLRHGRLALFVGPDYAGAFGYWRPSRVPRERPAVLVDPVLAERCPDDTRAAEDVIARVIEDGRANAESRRAHAGRYLLHTLANATAIAREGDVTRLTQIFAGTPALIVGAGPSLDDRLTEIASVADRAIVIACAAAARPLIAAGVAPHFIVAADPTEASAAHLQGLAVRTSWLVAEGSVHRTALAAFDRRTFIFNVSDHQPWPWLRANGIERGRLATWGSGATSALDLALRLGCGPILFAGLDFAFTNGRPYCRGTTFEANWATAMAQGQTFDAICKQLVNRWPVTLDERVDGSPERTAPHLVSFRNWIRQQIEAASHVRYMNVTPGGILHHRFIGHCSCDEALGHAAPLDARSIESQLRVLHRAEHARAVQIFPAIERVIETAQGSASALLTEWAAFADNAFRHEVLTTALRSHEYEAWAQARQSGAGILHTGTQ